MMKYLASFLFLFTNSYASDYIWSSATPTGINIVPNGMVLYGNFNQNGISCATGTKAIFLSNKDENFKYKLSLAITAKTTKKKIKVLLGAPLETNCEIISAHGSVPRAHHYYWIIEN